MHILHWILLSLCPKIALLTDMYSILGQIDLNWCFDWLFPCLLCANYGNLGQFKLNWHILHLHLSKCWVDFMSYNSWASNFLCDFRSNRPKLVELEILNRVFAFILIIKYCSLGRFELNQPQFRSTLDDMWHSLVKYTTIEYFWLMFIL